MKNQILEYDKSVGMNRKFGALKMGKILPTPVTLEFVEQKESKERSQAAGRKTRLIRWFLVIDSKNSETSVNCDNVVSMEENEKKLLVIQYKLAEGKDKDGKPNFVNKIDKFDCRENGLIMKTFQGIRKLISEGAQEASEAIAEPKEEKKSEVMAKILA